MAKYVLAIDQGTTGTTVSLVNEAGHLLCQTTKEYPQIFPKPGWVEHNPSDIWQSVVKAATEVLQMRGIAGKDVAVIGITNQRETVLLWDRKTSAPVYNAIVWQCRRTSEFCDQLKKRGLERQIYPRTGLVIDAYFSASKVNWLLKNIDGVARRARRGELAMGTIDTYLIWQLTGGKVHRTDVSNASRTMLMNLETCQWDETLLKIFGISEKLLPEICASNEIFGYTSGLGFLPDGIPIAGVAGDQQSALFGQTCFEAGQAKCTFGTGSFLLMNTGLKPKRSKSQLLTTVAWRLKGQKNVVYALEGSVFICGAAVQWIRDGLGIITQASEIEALASSVKDTGGVEFVPALTGLGAPYWNPEARGLICGITRGTTKAHLARATLEAMALQNTEILLAMQKDLGKTLKDLRVDGGASSNNLLMQIQANYLGVKIQRPEIIETTSLGAAYLAGLGVGIWSDLNQIKKIWRVEKEFTSQMDAKSRRARLAHWKKAIARSIL